MKRSLALALALLMVFGAMSALAGESNSTKVIRINASTFPDKSFRKYVQANIDTNGDNKLSSAEIKAVTSIDVSGKGIANLKGIEWFPNLQTIDCCENKLKKLDVSKNKKLLALSCYSNQLISLTLGKQNSLLVFACFRNSKLKKVDINYCPMLRSLIKKITPIKENGVVMWDNNDANELMAIDVKCKLTAGKKVLYKP